MRKPSLWISLERYGYLAALCVAAYAAYLVHLALAV
jgi:hypothetical protein